MAIKPASVKSGAVSTPESTPASLRAIALLAFGRGLLILLTAIALFSHLDTDWQMALEQVMLHLHLNPAKHTPRFLLELAHDFTQPRMLMIATGGLVYVALRWAEAYGLWFGKRWAKWLGLASAAVYLPLEVIELLRQPSWLVLALLQLNLIIVVVLWRNLRP
ncbi:DUF2127 domain-containing protein [Pseudomethylobacillus aquaticus]|uniref:DUF2127 domain-containing protein n=1 Tax=Pseudomethylobacillus aquaticus TaxID=2676064 RepID=A0A3N0V2A4_9PROT|nr:DUF2127 domain-containing protein [Pseudomethylobacillus aquaticus]ROH86937.1 DUF2127 domain-containing protein [Pseudomethylobacillus aquaticus]